MTIVLDCGTTNTKLYLVQGKSCIRETVLPVGIRNIAGGMTKTQLKNRIRDGIEHLVAESGTDEQVEKLVAYGMITSELGFCELPHLDAPAGLAELQKGVCVQTDPELIRGVPVVYIRGLRNKVCPALPQETQLSQFDFMRGEETQTIGILKAYRPKLPAAVIVLSSHTKFVLLGADGEIKGSYTTVSGQLYMAVKENTSIGKSLAHTPGVELSRSEDELIESAKTCLRCGGFTRAMMMPRFMESFEGYNEADRDTFFQAAIELEDLKLLEMESAAPLLQAQEYLILGQKRRSELFARLLREHIGTHRLVRVIWEQEEIQKINIAGTLAIADREERKNEHEL